MWGNVEQVDDWRIRVVFVMGTIPGYSLSDEYDAHRDLLVGNFTDAYDANSHKLLLSFKYAMHFCGRRRPPSFVFLVDDDHFVIVPNLVAEVGRHSPSEALYMGHLQVDTPPMRDVFNKNYVSLSEYPYNRNPPFISAGAVLLSRRTVELFYEAVPTTKLYKWDDVYAGILARSLNIEPSNNSNFRFHSASPGNQSMLTGIASHGYRLGI